MTSMSLKKGRTGSWHNYNPEIFPTVFSCEVQWPSRLIDVPTDLSLRLHVLISILLNAKCLTLQKVLWFKIKNEGKKPVGNI